jgi:hypothetical protein
MRSSFGVSVSITLLIEGQAVIALGANAVRHARWMLSALDYGNVRDVSHLSKNRDRLRIQGDLEVKMRGNQLLASGYCVTMRR